MPATAQTERAESWLAGLAAESTKLSTAQTARAGSHHMFSLEETSAFASVLNAYLGDDETLTARLPLDTQTTALFEACADGVLLCKLIALVDGDSVDVLAIHTTQLSKRVPCAKDLRKIENNNLAINAAADIGCHVTNIGAIDLFKATPHLILGLLWQIIRLLLLKKVRLLEGDELLSELLELEPERILVRWVNFHMTNAGSLRRIRKLGKELSDSEVYSTLMMQLYGARLTAVDFEAAPEQRASTVLYNARYVGVNPHITPLDIVSGNAKLNLAFVAELFNVHAPRVRPVEAPISVEAYYLAELQNRAARYFDKSSCCTPSCCSCCVADGASW
ncbi:calponin homology domain-containing protein [Pelagophyceae sp. CCMP2097]|nr:calponin homology domain-containing protein [Pelagophyceae sp. CCMP2097]